MTTLGEVLAGGSHTPVARVDLLSDDLRTILLTTTAVTGGTVVTDRTSDTFDAGTVTALNLDGLLTPSGVNAALTEDRPARIYRGAMVDDAPVYEPLMTGTVGQIKDDLLGGLEVSFTVGSRLAIAKRNFTGPTTFEVGLRGQAAIRRMAELGQLGADDRLYDLDDGGYFVTVPRSYDGKDEILGAMVKWAFDMGCDLYPDPLGRLTMRPFVDLSETLPVWDFDYRHLLSFPRDRQAKKPINRQTVTGVGTDGYPIRAEATIEDPRHPLAWRPDYDLPGDPYDAPDIHDAATLLRVAYRLLQQRSGVDEMRTAEVIAVPFVRAGRVATFSGSRRGDKFLLDTVACPIVEGAMRTTQRIMLPVMGTVRRVLPQFEEVILTPPPFVGPPLPPPPPPPASEPPQPPPTVTPPPQPPPTPTPDTFPKRIMWWPWGTGVDLATVQNAADHFAYLNCDGVVLRGMDWSPPGQAALPGAFDDSWLDEFISRGIQPILGLWTAECNPTEKATAIDAIEAGGGKWFGIVVDAETQWVNTVKDDHDATGNRDTAKAAFDDFMGALRSRTDVLMYAPYANPRAHNNYMYSWWNEICDYVMPQAYFDQPTDTGAFVVNSMYRNFQLAYSSPNSPSFAWSREPRPIVPLINVYHAGDDAAVAERAAYMDIAMDTSDSVAMWRWFTDGNNVVGAGYSGYPGFAGANFSTKMYVYLHSVVP